MLTLRAVLDRYALLRELKQRSVEIYGETVTRFGTYLGHEPTVDDLEDMTVAGFVRWRSQHTRGKTGRPISAETVTKDRTALLCLWVFACKKRLHPTGEWPGMPKRRRVVRTPDAYTADDIQRLVTAARYRIGTISGIPANWWWPGLILTLFQSGERIGAVMGTRWEDIDLARGWIRFPAEDRKGHSADNLRQITPDLAQWLGQRCRTPGDLVWPWDRLPRSLYASWKVLCGKAGVRNRAFHGFRKSSCSYIHAAGGDATAHAMHADPRMTREHYLDPKITGRGSALSLLPRIDIGPMPTGPDEATFIPDDGEAA